VAACDLSVVPGRRCAGFSESFASACAIQRQFTACQDASADARWALLTGERFNGDKRSRSARERAVDCRTAPISRRRDPGNYPRWAVGPRRPASCLHRRSTIDDGRLRWLSDATTSRRSDEPPRVSRCPGGAPRWATIVEPPPTQRNRSRATNHDGISLCSAPGGRPGFHLEHARQTSSAVRAHLREHFLRGSAPCCVDALVGAVALTFMNTNRPGRSTLSISFTLGLLSGVPPRICMLLMQRRSCSRSGVVPSHVNSPLPASDPSDCRG